MSATNRSASVPDPCIYCASVELRTKREHVVSQALGTFEHNWVLDCVCDGCNEYFSKHLELALGRDSLEGMRRIELGLRPPEAASKFLNRRMTATLQDPGPLDGARLVFAPTDDGTRIVPAPAPQVCFRRPGEPWRCLFEWELTPERLRDLGLAGDEPIEIRASARPGEGEQLRQKLAALGIEFHQTHAVLDTPFTEQPRITVAHDFQVDDVLIRAACKIAFNYAAHVLGADVVRRSEFDAARRFVRYGEFVEGIADVQHGSMLTGAEAATSRAHACAIGWDAPRRQLVAVAVFFNEMTYRLRLCQSDSTEWNGVSSQHIFDPISHTISTAPTEADGGRSPSYSDDGIEQLLDQLPDALSQRDDALTRAVEHSGRANDRAKEVLLNGVGRRLKTMRRALENVFALFPVCA